jgi:capsular exopolysaccharide synthesis family protein
VDFRRQIAVVRSWLPLFVALPLLAGAAGYLISSQLPKTYEAKVTLVVGQSLSTVNPIYDQLLASQSLSATYASVATTRPILDSVIKQLNLDTTTDELLKRVQANAPVNSPLLTVVARDTSRALAAAIANAVAAQLIADSPGIQGHQAAFQASIDAELQATQDQIATTQTKVDSLTALTIRTAAQDAQLASLQASLVTLRSTYATLLSFTSSNTSNVLTIVEPAVPPDSPASPKPLLNTLVAAIAGLLLAAGVAFALAYVDDTVKDSEAVREVANLGTLGAIERMKGRPRSEIYRLAPLLSPRSGVAEAYRIIRTNLEFASVDTPVQTLLVTSSSPGEGKTVTACNLAIVFAQAGGRVLLVDADLRKPGVHTAFDLPNSQGLTTLLRDDHAMPDAIAQVTEQENLRVLTSGPLPPNPAEILGSQRMRTILERLKAENDLIIFDSPPLLAVTDSAILSSLVDGTLLVVDAGRSRRRALRTGSEVLARAGANVLGSVLNRIPPRARAGYGNYYGGHPAAGRAEDGTPRTDGSPSLKVP